VNAIGVPDKATLEDNSLADLDAVADAILSEISTKSAMLPALIRSTWKSVKGL